MIEALGNHLWQSTVFAATAGLLTLTLRRNRAHVRYWLWLAASVKFLVPCGFLVAIGSQFAWPLASIAVEPRVVVAVQSIGRPFSQSGSQLSSAAVLTARDAGAAAPGLLMTLAAVAAVWFVGSSALAVVWAVRWTRVAAAVRRGSRLESGRELRLLRRLEQIGGGRRTLDVVSSDAPLEPGVFGIVRPVLLWPRHITAHLADEQVEAILAHELCHVRRRDNLAAAGHALVQALFWFHPLVWWVGARLVVERERACDEEVVRLGSDPRVYAESILKTCQLSVESPGVCVAGVSGSDLRKRIEQILESDAAAPLNAWRKIVLGTVGVAAIVVPIAIGVVSGSRLRAQAPAGSDARGRFGPPDLNRLAGFELLPGPPHLPTDDPRGAVAWNVVIDHPSGRLSFVGFTGRGLIRYAYGLRDLPVVSGPSWLDTESLELSASTSAVATDDELRVVLRKLFEDRVKLAAHHETRDFPVYALVPARSGGVLGPNLHPSTSTCLDAAALRRAALRGEVVRQRAGSFCGVERGISGMTFQRVTMTELAEELSRSGSMIDRTVVDRTGLTGTFDASLGLGFLPASIVLTRYPAIGVWLEPLGVRSIFNALPEQLGLKLNDTTMPGDVLVIDRAKRPE